uniref:rho GTPase-activating protein 15 n=1 Tax=Solea senegalensis TaxID=28829 RepID=UPI001CD81BCF|nr:rho GTPase-activating protein 15 [Solea senegalensis]
MAGAKVTKLQNQLNQQQQLSSVQLRTKSSQNCGERLSQSKSMVLQDSDLPEKPISRHRRNQSQYSVIVGGATAFETQGDFGGEQLNVTKISERGKKQRKNWTLMWSVLKSDQLLFYKDRQQITALKPDGRTDVVQLWGAVIEWITEKSSRKNVFQITTNTGSEYLIQVDNFSTANKWYDAIKRAIDSSTKADFHLRRSNSTENLHRHRSLPGYGSTSTNTKPCNLGHRRSINMFSSSKLKHSSSDITDKNGVKNRLRKFISRRPSIKTLQEKGLIKDRVFGCKLSTLCEREGTIVPKFIRMCLDAVDKRGLEVDGIYRVSGNLATIQKLRFIIDQEEQLDLDQHQWDDVHVITGALKMFFRELPEPLFPFSFFQLFVDVIKIKDSKQKVQALKKLIHELPRVNQETMKLLFTHLNRVLEFSKKNLMSTQGMAIVFGPTLMWPELDGGNMAVNMVFQNQVVELVLRESPEIFNPDRK